MVLHKNTNEPAKPLCGPGSGIEKDHWINDAPGNRHYPAGLLTSVGVSCEETSLEFTKCTKAKHFYIQTGLTNAMDMGMVSSFDTGN